jgi:hypothetical protein
MQRCAASGAQARAKLAQETALLTVSTMLLALNVRAHCYDAIPLAPVLGIGAATVQAGVGRKFRSVTEGFKLFVSGIPADKYAPCVESSRAYESRQCARNARNTRSCNTVSTEHGESHARTNSKVRADFCELLGKSAFTVITLNLNYV